MSQEKLHWYTFTFKHVLFEGKSQMSTLNVAFSKKNLTKKDIDEATKDLGFDPKKLFRIIIINSMYLGHMTEKEFLS